MDLTETIKAGLVIGAVLAHKLKIREQSRQVECQERFVRALAVELISMVDRYDRAKG